MAATSLDDAGASWTRRIDRYIKARLVWHRFYRAMSYARSALWIVPLVSIVLVLAFVPILRSLDAWLGWKILGLQLAGAQALYQTVITLTLSFMVFTFGSLLVAIQIAGGQLTPRIIATTLLRDNVVRYSVGLFVFTLVFTVMALDRLVDRVHEMIALGVVLLGIACIANFLFLIDYAARMLRPISIVGRVCDEGLAVIESMYPEPVSDADEADPVALMQREAPARVVRHSGDSGILLAVDVETLVAEARRRNGLVELLPQVGDFVSHSEPLFALYAGAATIDDRRLRAAVAIGAERTMEQDPLFAFRILVDIALKALSPAINDPTTAVLAIDQVHRLLKAVGRRRLHVQSAEDSQGAPRLIHRTPNWGDYVHIACCEIRACGASNVQVARRLRAMLVDLAASLPGHRLPALKTQAEHLDRALETLYPIADDLALARMPDAQGLGASSRPASAVSLMP